MGRRRGRRHFIARREQCELQSPAPFNGRIVTDVVDNPYQEGPAKIEVTRSIRDDPLAGLYSRRHIDTAQFHAGRRYQHYYETAGVGMVRAMDPMKEPVDGRGASHTAFNDAQLYAFHKLKEARAHLGIAGDRLVREVLGDGIEIKEIARRRGYLTQRDVVYLGKRFRECLETLAVAWGYAAISTASSTAAVDNLKQTTAR
jgi:hypothetical protein